MPDPLIVEIVGSQEGEESYDSPRSTLKFVILNVEERVDATALAFAACPPTYRNLNLNNIRMDPHGSGIWYADAMYTRFQSRVPGSMSIQFDIAGETQKLTHGINQVNYPAPNPAYNPDLPDGPTNEPDLPAIDFNLAIGVSNSNGQIKVEGIDEFFPTFAFTITRVFGTTTLTLPGQDTQTTDFPLTTSYIQAMYQAQRTTNSAPVSIVVQGITLNFEVGQLWFQGGTATIGSDGHTELVLKFAADPGLTNATIAGIEGINKRGWEHLEVYYEETEDVNANQLVPKARQVMVTQTKYESDLNVLFA